MQSLSSLNTKKPLASSEALPRGSETVLVVTHEPALREYSAWILQELGYRVVEATDGQDAICLMHNSPHRQIDLVIADAAIPRVCGKQLAHRLAAFLPRSRILIISNYPQELAVHNDLLDTELNFIQKPVSRAALAVKVRGVLDRARDEDLEFMPAATFSTFAVR